MDPMALISILINIIGLLTLWSCISSIGISRMQILIADATYKIKKLIFCNRSNTFITDKIINCMTHR